MKRMESPGKANNNASDHLPAGGAARFNHLVHTLPSTGQLYCVVRGGGGLILKIDIFMCHCVFSHS